ncbi:MAG: SufD family Fe-S cluster assembly protein [Steroidobacteraceae bacterium]
MSNELTQRIAQEHAAAAQSLPSGVVARARRRRAIDALVARGLPTTRDENWRYASLRPLERVRFAPAPARADLAPDQLPPPIQGYARYVFIDGLLAAAASAPGSPWPGVTVHTPSRPADGGAAEAGASGTPAASAEPDRASTPDSAFGLLNDAFALDSAEIDVGAAASAEPACIEVVFAASAPAQQGASYPRLRVSAAPHTQLRLIERHVSLAGDASFVDAAVEVQLHDGAAIDHYRVQQLGARAVWMDTLSASVGRSAAYRLHGINLGAQSARSTMHVHLRGDGAQLALHAVSAGDRQQVLDQYAVVDHAAPHTRTEESFRGIAAGRARVAFNGKIIVRPGAHGADSSQSLRGLLAGADAEIDVRPQLEIYTDDVRCSHGATAGKLDEAMLFYLLSRGLDRDTAKLLLKWAFLEDVVSKIAVAALRRQIEQSLAGQIQESDTLKELL